MLFKLAKFCLKRFGSSAAFAGAVLGLGPGAGTLARATLTISPLNGTIPVATPSPYVQGDLNFYYYVTGFGSRPLTNGAFLDPAVTSTLDVSKAAGYNPAFYAGETVGDSGTLANAFGVKITTTTSVVSGSNTVVMIQYGTRYVPVAGIAGADGGSAAACNNQNCAAYNLNGLVAAGNPSIPAENAPFYAARVFGNSFTVYFYPRDICKDLAGANGLSANFCSSGGAMTDPESLTTLMSSMGLSFVIIKVDGATSLAKPTGSAIDSTPSGNSVKFNFQTSASTFNCPDLSAVTIKPDDQRIYIDASQFQLTGSAAPGSSVIVVGQDQAGRSAIAPNLNSTFSQSGRNSVVSQVTGSYGNSLFFASGFTNSTPGTDEHPYFLGFMIEDQAGIITPPATPSPAPSFPPISGNLSTQSCSSFGPIYTSSVYGVLPQGAKCFIATAAFQSPDAAPVLLLRKFRDQILLSSSFGEAFVDWYYDWSPAAASWLDHHPVFRMPVLLGLADLELIAWFCLHPWFYFSILIGALGLSGVLISLRNRGGKIHAA